VYWCFHCYAVNGHPTGPCDVCGQLVEAAAGLTYADGLIWALHQADGDRAVLAAQTLGRLRARQAVPALRAMAAEHGGDIYVREAALRSLIAIEGAGPAGGTDPVGPLRRAGHSQAGAGGGITQRPSPEHRSLARSRMQRLRPSASVLCG
jgi:hypothetical protein